MKRLPSLFVSHGSPMFAVEPGQAGPHLTALGRDLRDRTRAVLVLSPHWMTRGLQVTTTMAPETIHDFGGFPEQLYRLHYPAPGSTSVALRALELLNADGWNATSDARRGLDHGAWVPLMHLFPDAGVPVIQVSMPHNLDAEGAVRMGRALAPLAAEGVLIVGSGSITHNLYEVFHDGGDVPDAHYAQEFVDWARQSVQGHDEAALVHYLAAPHGRRAHPTPEHYLPLPFAFGAAAAGKPVQVLDGGMTLGVLAMDSYVFG